MIIITSKNRMKVWRKKQRNIIRAEEECKAMDQWRFDKDFYRDLVSKAEDRAYKAEEELREIGEKYAQFRRDVFLSGDMPKKVEDV